MEKTSKINSRLRPNKRPRLKFLQLFDLPLGVKNMGSFLIVVQGKIVHWWHVLWSKKPIMLLLVSAWRRQKSKSNERPGPNESIHGVFFFQKIKGRPWIFIRNLRVIYLSTLKHNIIWWFPDETSTINTI